MTYVVVSFSLFVKAQFESFLMIYIGPSRLCLSQINALIIPLVTQLAYYSGRLLGDARHECSFQMLIGGQPATFCIARNIEIFF
jgi:hypothetical protein